MNQAIQIIDGFEYDLQYEGLKILAINSGALINCYITEVNQDEAEGFYALHQFDAEEHLSSLIEQERFNHNGDIVLSKSELLG
ncbi:hypothetical protein Q4574_19990 [Aliiglaciecola sp. 3_MG-2023]|uniref:DUF1488 family protein n=1 Tax=Aliiglaciecola sp. 3_MG-2023 TaxID=3062644 RepID=UPI0026E19075|nr:hypothetical protein [Aliiglaciecola sp. 3_MG-2023]MDO6695591.1 hypothetical protein [Aliiglaciecola sp. 3_MG-2023]